MATTPETKSNTRLILDFFFDGKATGHMTEIKKLTDQDKVDLGEGIRNGSLTY